MRTDFTGNSRVHLPTNTPDAKPTLMLGLIGFNREQEGEIRQLLVSRAQAAVGWRTAALPNADAWWVNGARAKVLADGSVRIAPADPCGRSIRLALADVSRPIAFCEPLANHDLEPAYSFSISNPASVSAVLEVMETKWLACTAVRRWLAGRLIAASQTLSHRMYHLVCGEKLLTVINRALDIGWLPGVTIEELENARWVGRPLAAGFVPQSFHRSTISELVWDYAVHSPGDLLPARYRSHRIHFRRPPGIAPSLIGDDHLLVMRELVVQARSFTELEQRTGLEPAQLAQALAALYFTGSITTNERRADQSMRAGAATASAAPADSSQWWPSRTGTGQGALAYVADFTVPTPLRHQCSPAGAARREDDGSNPARHTPA